VRALRTGARCIIAEMKKASPSAGLLRPRYAPSVLARRYEEAGAAGISVLTEPRKFLGSPRHLAAARAACGLPVLRKDFISEPYQVWEAAAWGADVVLLIASVLDDGTMRALHREAGRARLEVLVEAHTADELKRARRLDGAILGVNSRNLRTMRTDLAVAFGLARLLPRGVQAVAESGIRTRDDIERLRDAGYSGFLIGETLMRSARPWEELMELSGGA